MSFRQKDLQNPPVCQVSNGTTHTRKSWKIECKRQHSTTKESIFSLIEGCTIYVTIFLHIQEWSIDYVLQWKGTIWKIPGLLGHLQLLHEGSNGFQIWIRPLSGAYLKRHWQLFREKFQWNVQIAFNLKNGQRNLWNCSMHNIASKYNTCLIHGCSNYLIWYF